MKKITNKIILVLLAIAMIPSVSYADSYSYGSGDFYSYDDSYSSGDYYGYNDSYSSGDYYGYGDSYSSGDYYSYEDDYSYGSGDYYSYDDSYSSGDYYSYDDYYSSGDYYSYDDSYSSGDYYSYEDDYSYGSGDFYSYTNDYYSANNSYYPQNNHYAYNDGFYGNNDYYAYSDWGQGNDWGGFDNGLAWGNDWGWDNNWGGCSSNCGGTNPPVYDNLDVICTVSDRTIEEGDTVTFTATADGGRGSYTYRWTGDVSGSSRSVTERFTQEGTYNGTVRVTDRDGRTATSNCGSVRVEEEDDEDEDFDVVCKVSDTSIEEGDSVRFTAEVDGGDSPYEYDWSGDVDEDEKTFTKRFSREGRYEVELRVTDDEGRTARDTCSIIRVDEENDNNNRDRDDDRDINVSSGTLSSGSGTLSGVSSVYLNQIPYTGPEDVAKVIAFIVAILAWSIAGAMIIKNRMNKKSISNRVAAFKESNKSQI